MSVEALPELRVHPSEEVLEEYCLGRVQDPAFSRVEEHLLLCPECCARVTELDEYLSVMKAGLAEIAASDSGLAQVKPAEANPAVIEERPMSRAIYVPSLSLHSSLPATLSALPGGNFIRIAALVIFVVSATLAWRAQHNTADAAANGISKTEVLLVAMRGGSADGMPSVKAGSPLRLRINRRGLPESSGYRVEVVDASGRADWSGAAEVSDDNLNIGVSPGLKSGTYWVRLYSTSPDESENGALLREFGLRIE